MNGVSLGLAVLMGFTGSLHCAGMCGPIVWVMPFQSLSGARRFAGIALYHLGRISVYAMLAFILRSFAGVFQPHVQQIVSLVLGITLLLAGVLSFISGPGSSFRLPWSEYVRNKLSQFISRPSLSTLLIAGTLNGLLPCGLVYMALSAAISAGSTAQAITFVYVFGAGTLPVLLSITILKKRLSILRYTHLKKLVPLSMFVIGSLVIVRGMNLGIPYLSPKVEMSHNKVHASCCHKH